MLAGKSILVLISLVLVFAAVILLIFATANVSLISGIGAVVLAALSVTFAALSLRERM